MIQRIRCWLGMHAGHVKDGAFRCQYCKFSESYRNSAPTISFEDYNWACGHVGPAVCQQCWAAKLTENADLVEHQRLANRTVDLAISEREIVEERYRELAETARAVCNNAVYDEERDQCMVDTDVLEMLETVVPQPMPGLLVINDPVPERG